MRLYDREREAIRLMLEQIDYAAFSAIRHICIIGAPGSGKTTLACKLGSVLKRPVIQLDDLVEDFWKRMGRGIRDEEWAEILRTPLQREHIITDGFYLSSLSYRFANADIM